MNTLFKLLPLILIVACNDDDTDTGDDDDDGTPNDTDTTPDTDTDTNDTDVVTDPFVFASDPASAYVRVDRMGMPAVATAVITYDDAYNAADPVDDAAGTFVTEITGNVGFLHGALDDDLAALSLAPCVTESCVGQAAPYVVPDVIQVDTLQPAGFPNGRTLPDQVIDITLALILLDLTQESVTTFADLPLNPAANDVAFPTGFPYLAAAH
jgi:hypothetical protein